MKAFITGITGQGGYYLSELLITKGVANQDNADQINNSDDEFLELILDKIRNN